MVDLPEVEAYDLELYAINTGAFYETHKRLAPEGHSAWMHHLRATVIPLYCKEVRRVSASGETLATTATALKAYYVQHLKEF